MSAPDPVDLVEWESVYGGFRATYEGDVLEVTRMNRHIWRWKVTGPTRGAGAGHSIRPGDAMREALRFVDHPGVREEAAR